MSVLIFPNSRLRHNSVIPYTSQSSMVRPYPFHAVKCVFYLNIYFYVVMFIQLTDLYIHYISFLIINAWHFGILLFCTQGSIERNERRLKIECYKFDWYEDFRFSVGIEIWYCWARWYVLPDDWRASFFLHSKLTNLSKVIKVIRDFEDLHLFFARYLPIIV